ncbi:hypothetical protein V8C44DRAFT_361689 [Trichoderma aethiopicum]
MFDHPQGLIKTWTEDTKPIVHTKLPYPDTTTKPKKSTNPFDNPFAVPWPMDVAKVDKPRVLPR